MSTPKGKVGTGGLMLVSDDLPAPLYTLDTLRLLGLPENSQPRWNELFVDTPDRPQIGERTLCQNNAEKTAWHVTVQALGAEAGGSDYLLQLHRPGDECEGLPAPEQAQLLQRLLQYHREQMEQMREQVKSVRALADIGTLVASVSHELNSPLGLTRTAATHLASRVDAMRAGLNDQSLSLDELNEFLDEAGQTADLSMSNLARATDLIRSFKSVAVDQSQDAAREFELGHVLDEISLSLQPRLRDCGHHLALKPPGPCAMHSYAGALAQILTNLVNNSIDHGLPDEGGGIIELHARRQGNDVILEYSDDGKGMSAENLADIYEPFFTTRRGQGNSGLGMHIVQALVQQRLGGRIECHSSLGQGFKCRLQFPQRAPKLSDEH